MGKPSNFRIDGAAHYVFGASTANKAIIEAAIRFTRPRRARSVGVSRAHAPRELAACSLLCSGTMSHHVLGDHSRWFRLLALATLLLVSTNARAQTSPPDVTSAPSQAPVSSAPPPPSAEPSPPPRAKGRITDRDLKDKREGGYFTGLPLLDSDPDTGYGFGARVYHYWDGPRSDPLFAYEPYQHRLSAIAFMTTNGFQLFGLDWDAPNIGGSTFRLRAAALYERNQAANYFGVGTASLSDLHFSGAPGTYPTFSGYTAALRQLRPNKTAYTRYNKFDSETPTLLTTLDRDLLGGLVRLQVGFMGSYERVRDYTGTATVADDPANNLSNVAATMGTTLLREDCNASRILGCNGGVHNTLKLGIAFDTRDFEPDPNSGVFIDAVLEASNRWILSDFNYVRAAATFRGFFSPFPAFADLVIAGRAFYSVQSAGVPFFAMSTLPFTDGDRQGLGGLPSLRGYVQNRFVGPVTALGNVEVRWTFVKFGLLNQTFGLSVAPFVDAGRVFDNVRQFSFTNWKLGEGAGFRIAWNQSTIIVCDVGASREDVALYLDFGHQF